MRSSFTATTGLKLARSPSVRAQVARRRLAVAGVFLGLAAAGALAGALTGHRDTNDGRASPLSYFPSE